ncbi:hypothetical protein GGF32_002712 [Allomyces javanicus]|nr:hypothetical protein GGF32_002712 [Allomyces javanicus]
MWALHASKIAAAIGDNPYVPPGDVAREMWQKRFPDQYRAAMARTHRDQVEEVRQTAVKNVLSTHAATISDMIQTGDHRERDRKLDQLVTSLPADVQQDLRSEIASHVATTRGTVGEAVTIAKIERETNVSVRHNNDKYHKIKIEADGTTFIIGGKTDGIIDVDGERILVEIKNRQRRFMGRVPTYELVQCQTLMKVTGLSKCRHVEQFGKDTRTTDLVFDPDLWESIQRRATAFIQKLDRLTDNEDAQDDLVSFGSI